MSFNIQSLCDKGVVRPNNEDAIAYGIKQEQSLLWMIVADGMGGHNAGEVASQILVDYVEQQMQMLTQSSQNDYQTWMKQILLQANQHIFKVAEENAEYQGMGTTGVWLIVANNQLNVAWVGDSRAYLLREQRLTALTQDHTMIQHLLNRGVISKAEAKRSNTKHILSRAIGIKQEVVVDFYSQSIKRGDVLMLSTDGLHGHVAKEVIAGYLAQSVIGREVCQDMVKMAIEYGSRDNLTVGIVTVNE